MRHIIIIVFIFLNFAISAQNFSRNKKSNKYFNQAVEAYNAGNSNEALIFCDKATQKDADFTEPYVLKAQILHDQNNTEQAAELLKKVLEISPNYTPVYYILANYLAEIYKFDEAIKYANDYLKREDDKQKQNYATKLIELCKFRQKTLDNPLSITPQRLPSEINTELSEFFPTISADYSTIIFTRLMPDESRDYQEDIYVSHTDGKNYTQAVSISPLINTFENEGAHTLSTDGTLMIFTRCIYPTGCDLYVTQKDERGYWLPPAKLPSPVNTRYKETQPCLAPDNKTLYFVSNRPGGKGKLDIWKTTFLGSNKWSKPVNLGDSINTPGIEMSPFIHFDNKTLYFSSDFWLGMGKTDIFMSKKIDDTTWTTPRNLGYPINTKQDEYRLVVSADGKTAYYSSARDTAFKQDIYSFTMPEILRPQRTIYVKTMIYDSLTYRQINADIVSIINITNNDTIFFTHQISKFIICLPINGEYALNILKKGYLFVSYNFNLKKIPDSINHYDIDIYMKPILKNQTFVMKNVFFETDSYQINPKSYAELNNLVEFLTLNNNLDIQINGHTDSIGAFDYNIKLSENRAKSVANYLISKNIDSKRIKYKGFGYTKPIAQNQTETDRKLNRRTEIMIIKK